MPQSDTQLLQRLPNVGPKKAQRLVQKFGQNPSGTMYGITTASLNEIASIKGFTQDSASKLQADMRRYDIERGVYDDDPRERKSKTFGEFSSEVTSDLPGASTDPEDSALTAVEETEFSRQDKSRAEKFHDVRTDQAKAVDEALDAPVADSFDQWRNNKDEFDIPGIDGHF